MKFISAVVGAALFIATVGAPLAQSHHSNVAFEVTKVVTITGVVKEFRWVNGPGAMLPTGSARPSKL